MEEGRGAYSFFVGRPKGKKLLGRPRHRWENNIKIDLREVGINGTNWIWLTQDRLQWRAFVSIVMNHTKSRLLFDKLSDYQLFKEYPTPWSE
jgi:hypothetical protein